MSKLTSWNQAGVLSTDDRESSGLDDCLADDESSSSAKKDDGKPIPGPKRGGAAEHHRGAVAALNSSRGPGGVAQNFSSSLPLGVPPAGSNVVPPPSQPITGTTRG